MGARNRAQQTDQPAVDQPAVEPSPAAKLSAIFQLADKVKEHGKEARDADKALKPQVSAVLKTLDNQDEETIAGFCAGWLSAYKEKHIGSQSTDDGKKALSTKIDNRRRMLQGAFGDIFEGQSLTLKAVAGSKTRYHGEIKQIDNVKIAKTQFAAACRKLGEMGFIASDLHRLATEALAAGDAAAIVAAAGIDFGDIV